MAHFLCKLAPPRPTFFADMSGEEREAILAHQDYWLPYINAGLVIAMGVVADPAGPYGVMIANAPSRAMLEDWQARDPIILAKGGFLFETYPMPSIRVAPVEPMAPVSSVTP